MKEIVDDPVCDRHPPQLKYTLRFLKKYMEGGPKHPEVQIHQVLKTQS